MMPRIVLSACVLAVSLSLLPGCRKRSRDAATQPSGSGAEASAPALATNPSTIPKDVPPAEALHFLNDGVRNFYAEKLKMPASLDEVYAAGYLKERYNPPAGRQYVINPQTRGVELR
ncbi:MAG: hypothetical protein FJ406_11820 [Verrucomicrobia bacterium]|nr:hypothetical protein [Verrucomicrobiota bacterium]